MADPQQPPRPAPATDAIERQVAEAQAEMVLTRHRVSNWLGVPFGGLVCWVLWHDVDQALLLAWLAARVLISVWRVAVTRRFDRERGHPGRVMHWATWHDRALAADGVAYGLLGTLLLPRHNPELEAIMIATLVGVASIGLIVLAIRQRSALAMVLPTMVPTMVLQFFHDDRLSTYVGVGIGLFLFLVVHEGGKASRHTRDMLRIRFQMDELATQRAEALALAQRHSDVKDRFLATMSHEMRTPLHGILGLARLLQQHPPRSGGALPPDSLRVLERTGEHLLGVINDVLDFSKMQAGHLTLARQDFDLVALVESMVEVARVSAVEKGLSVDCEIALPRPCWVSGDPTRLRQILLNLTGNAVKFTAAGAVRVRLARQAVGPAAGGFQIDVADSGPGVPADQREAIFEAFHQVDGSDRRRHGGTGLGLTISRELARCMGGELDCIDSGGPGAAFRFRVALPAAQAPAPPPAPVTRPGHGLRGRLLLVEDNPVNALVAQLTLERLGLDAELVTDGQQAVARVAAESFDLVLMDCQMPVLDGFQAARRIRELERAGQRRPVPIVALTAHAMDADRERSLDAGMTDHLAKPFREDELVAVLRRHLKRQAPG
ncbi:response regulator [Ideonella sp. A 288]|uniref:response regulator n=1 Tax=Ideonella sp. A 288 TaxID=1962181 RepID=UPI0011846D52|nr:response regulator [Ideonella sp. A 288]